MGDDGRVTGASYAWRADQTDAERVDAMRRWLPDDGTIAPAHSIPGPDDCRRCHLPTAGGVLGVNTRQLNRPVPGGFENQLVGWSRLGLLDRPVAAAAAAALPALPPADSPGLVPRDAARAYLDVNCAFCHRPGGAVADFDASWDASPDGRHLVGAPARINLGVDRARLIAPNDPWRSIILARMATREPTQMPPLGRDEVDRRGVELVRAWVAALPGPEVTSPPTIRPAGGDYPAPVLVTIAHDDPSAEVRYTLDGHPPGPNSALYVAPLTLEGAAIVRARAFRPGQTRSITVQETFIIPTRESRTAP
jgi:hypothetical protein